MKAVFLDRDGTLMVDVGYLSRPDQVQIFPDVRRSLIRLKEAGFQLIIVTNQSGIERGYFTESDFWSVQTSFERQLGGKLIDAVYFCQDSPEASSERRKPSPGMLREAAENFKLDLAKSFMIGDKVSDIEAGLNAGLKLSIFVGDDALEAVVPNGPVRSASTFAEAADIVLEINRSDE
jgi:D-glycero-D-manno-heptose 1,7-bisphosphate phosphatase